MKSEDFDPNSLWLWTLTNNGIRDKMQSLGVGEKRNGNL